MKKTQKVKTTKRRKSTPSIYVGITAEAVRAARDAIVEILKMPATAQEHIEAVRCLAQLAVPPEHTLISNNYFHQR